MSELKPCPFCGTLPQANAWIFRGISETRYFCPNQECPLSVRTVTLEDWNTRPIEDALLTRAEKAEAENAKLKEERRWIPVREQMPTSVTQWVLLKNGKMDFDFTYIDGGRYDVRFYV